MYRNILIPVDLSEKNEQSVKNVAGLVSPDAARITLLHVIETIEDLSYQEMPEFYDKIQEKAEAVLEHWRGELAEKGFSVTPTLVYGRASKEIIQHAEANGIDLIVMSSHALDRSNPSRSFGTLSHQIAVLARCPVLLVR